MRWWGEKCYGVYADQMQVLQAVPFKRIAGHQSQSERTPTENSTREEIGRKLSFFFCSGI